MDEGVAQGLQRHLLILAEFACDAFTEGERAYRLAVLKSQGEYPEVSDVAIHTHFAMSHAAYRGMKLYCIENEEVHRIVEVDCFLRRFSEFSAVFSGNWLATAGPDAMGSRLENLEAAYRSLQALTMSGEI